MDELQQEIAREISKQVPLKEVYEDFVEPTVKSTGQLVGLVPRAINAALQPLHIWILNKEYNIAETKKLLEVKLENVSADSITSPEAYIAIPALQAISYCKDNYWLRNVWANLLAGSMNKDIKKHIHPAYIEIIKQLSPDEVKILSILYQIQFSPFIRLQKINPKGTYQTTRSTFSLIGEMAKCENVEKTPVYMENMKRLSLIYFADRYLSDADYDSLSHHATIEETISEIEQIGCTFKVKHGYFEMSVLGNSFCKICI
ncbi:MAG: DUF4393 domain-containing protein [Bacteroidales bacterium]|nr:DUF4393 domain-containing protein [Bacteroidales bacterium]